MAVNGNSEEFHKWMKEFYEDKPRSVGKDNYEYYRWFSSERRKMQYKFSFQSLVFHLKDIKIKNFLEIGCGPGTWTKVLIKKYPNAKIDCVELSQQMINQFKKNVKDGKRVKTKIKSFLDFDTDKKYDFIFSSRAIEYIPNKDKVIEKIWKFMEPGGKGMIITSPPHPFVLSIKKLLGKKIDKEHIDRISVTKMRELLEKEGFQNIEMYPILFTDTLPAFLRKMLWKNLYRKKFGLLSKMFASGYLVKFGKPERRKE
ncbi:hypothetical protein COV15_03160 [Candidatus Woesearchaeota archaeon CG10_big_fil_rev_8_21_14_0_10_34_12]|nr:MAG: hypothetical protein COV15_03160 [Candidatus Woesearchaeota archaeon CG10_big_fil_rev_8_21_14_0_10_34_12]